MIKSATLEIESILQDERATLSIAGELDIATAPRLQDAVSAVLEQGALGIRLDLARLTFVDSSGLRLFILLSDHASREGWELSLTRPPSPARAVFQITGAEENLPFVGELT
jgi:anti-sigma B factor antagonist